MNEKQELIELGLRIKNTRKTQNLKQSELDIPAPQIARYENGENAIGIINFKHLCEKLKVSADYLLDLPNEFEELSDEKKVNYLMMKKLSRDNDLKLTGMILAMLEGQDK